jgi:hypothetical protein
LCTKLLYQKLSIVNRALLLLLPLHAVVVKVVVVVVVVTFVVIFVRVQIHNCTCVLINYINYLGFSVIIIL